MPLDNTPDWQARLRTTDRRATSERTFRHYNFVSNDPFETIAMRNGFTNVHPDGQLYSQCHDCGAIQYDPLWGERCGDCLTALYEDYEREREEAKVGSTGSYPPRHVRV